MVLLQWVRGMHRRPDPQGGHALTARMGAAQVIIFAREAAADHFSGPLELLLQTRALVIPDSEGSQNLDTLLDSPESPCR